MKINKLVSIVIPARNAGKYLDRCIRSCLEQTYPNVEIIIVDNASNDDTTHIAAFYASAYSKVKFYTTSIKGVSVARNKGLNESKGEFVFFLDADDEIPCDAIEHLLNKAIKSECEITVGAIEHVEEDGRLISLMENRGDAVISSVERIEQVRKTWLGHLWGILYNRSLFVEPLLCPVDLKIGEDLLQNIQLLIRTSRVAIIPNIVYRYIRHPSSTINSRLIPSDAISSDERILLTSLQQLKNIVPEDRHICSEIDLLSLFTILNMPCGKIRNELIVNNCILLLKIAVFNFRNVKKLCNISIRMYIGVLFDIIKSITSTYLSLV